MVSKRLDTGLRGFMNGRLGKLDILGGILFEEKVTTVATMKELSTSML